MHLWFPQWKALNLAENATHTMHNVCPLRGAQVRDALLWSKYLNRALARFGDEVEVVYAQHHWPIWGNGRCRRYVAEQRDLYKYLHDQTVRLMSHGWRPTEIAEMLQLPGLGPKRVRALYEELHVTSLPALARAARDGRIHTLPGFGAKIDPPAFARAVDANNPDFVHETPLHAVSLTNLTECGLAYQPAEIAAFGLEA
jgi:hypothetical protein